VDFFAAPGVGDAADRQALAVLGALRAALDRLAGADFAPRVRRLHPAGRLPPGETVLTP